MDAVRVKGEEVAEGDSTLVVIVKQEDEEEGEQLATSFTPSLFIKQEEEDGEGDSVVQFQSLQCLQCFMTFRDQETTERHLRFKHPAEYERQLRGRTVFACCVCDLTFPSSAQLSAHQRTHSKWSLPPGGLEDSLQRERQGGEWDRGEGGERKVEIPMEERPDPEKQRPSPLQQGSGLSSGAALALRCLQCHIIFTDQHTWDRHMRAKHPSPAGHAPLPPRPPRGQPRPYCCPACGERFIQQGSLTQHYSETHSR